MIILSPYATWENTNQSGKGKIAERYLTIG